GSAPCPGKARDGSVLVLIAAQLAARLVTAAAALLAADIVPLPVPAPGLTDEHVVSGGAPEAAVPAPVGALGGDLFRQRARPETMVMHGHARGQGRVGHPHPPGPGLVGPAHSATFPRAQQICLAGPFRGCERAAREAAERADQVLQAGACSGCRPG